MVLSQLEDTMDKIEFDLAVNHCPVSYHRLPAAHADEQIHNPGCARANVAVSTTMPLDESEWAKQYRDYVRYLSSCC